MPRFPRLIFGTLGALGCLLGGAVLLEASDNFTVNYGANSNIIAHTVCKKVTNNSGTGLSIYVPTQSSAEWTSFQTHPPTGVTLAACGCSAQTVPWQTNCSASVPALANGSSTSVSNTATGYVGSGTASCVNGTLTMSTTTCSATGTFVLAGCCGAFNACPGSTITYAPQGFGTGRACAPVGGGGPSGGASQGACGAPTIWVWACH